MGDGVWEGLPLQEGDLIAAERILVVLHAGSRVLKTRLSQLISSSRRVIAAVTRGAGQNAASSQGTRREDFADLRRDELGLVHSPGQSHSQSLTLPRAVVDRVCLRGVQAQSILVLWSQRCAYGIGVRAPIEFWLPSSGLTDTLLPPADIAVAKIMSAHAPTTNDAFVRTPEI